MNFGQSGFAQFMASASGRAIRIIAGLALIAWGFPHRHDIGGVVLPLVGLLVLAAGAFDVCVISGLFGGPLRGVDIRKLKPRT